jgi:hypothetical protein
MKRQSNRIPVSSYNPLAAAILAAVMAPGLGWGCGCSCSVFDVKTNSMLPTAEGGVAFLEFNYVNQKQNWNGESKAPSADNGDKQVETEFYIVGAEYMFNRDWGMIAEVPCVDRYFRTTDDAGNIVSFRHEGLGDIRLKAIYAGFSPDLSSGVTLGLKLPTGSYTKSGFDRDTQIGTGSTDLLIGGFYRGTLAASNSWNWFLTGQLDQPVLHTDAYRPGTELNAIGGLYYKGWSVGGCKIAPVAQVIGSHNWNDQGTAANSSDTGYSRILLTAGVEVDKGPISFYADIAVPVYQNVNGNQLMPLNLVTVRMSYSF